MKHFNKLLSIGVIVAIIFSSVPVPVSAQVSAQKNKQDYQIEDNKDSRIVTGKTTEGAYEFNYNKITNEITYSLYSNTNNELISSNTVDIDDFASSESEPENSAISSRASTTNESTYSNWEYTITHGTTNSYELRSPGPGLFDTYYFNTRMWVGYNDAYIYRFINAVEEINTIEGVIVASLGLSVVLAGVSIVLSGGLAAPFWGAYIAALTADSTAIGLGFALDSQCNIASANYWDTFYHQY